MPRLGHSETKVLVLPSTAETEDKATLTIKTKLTLGDNADIFKIEGPIDQTMLALERLIVDWNYTVDGTPDTAKLPINAENIRKLDPADFVFLYEFVKGIREEQDGLGAAEKKASPSGLTPEETPTSTTPQQITVITEE